MLRMVVCRVLHPGRRLYNVSVGLHSGLSVGLYSGLTGYSFCGVKGSRSQGCRVCVFLLKGGEIQFLKRQSNYPVTYVAQAPYIQPRSSLGQILLVNQRTVVPRSAEDSNKHGFSSRSTEIPFCVVAEALVEQTVS